MLLSIGNRLRFEFDLFIHVRTMLTRIAEMRRVAVGRRAIARMDARMLSDIGLSHGDALAEISRRPWDVAPKAGLVLRDI